MSTTTSDNNKNIMELVSEHQGHTIKHGSRAGDVVNSYKIWKNNKIDKMFVEMSTSTEVGGSFWFDYDDLEKVNSYKLGKNKHKKPIWRGMVSNDKVLIGSSMIEGKMTYFHDLIMDSSGYNENTRTIITHMDGDTLNNCKYNLKVEVFETKKKTIKNNVKNVTEDQNNEFNYDDNIPGITTPISKHKGNMNHIGKFINNYEIWEDEQNNKVVKMYTEYKNSKRSFWFDYCDLEKVLERTWRINNKSRKNEKRERMYVYSYKNGNNKQISLHQLITGHYGKGYGPGQRNVDHIDRNPFNNRQSNLRVVSQSVQNKNVGKKNTRKDAMERPPEIKEAQCPVGAYWIKRAVLSKGVKTGEYTWKVEIKNHEAISKGLIKRWSSKGGKKKTPTEHVQQAIDKLTEMDMLIEQYNQTTT